MSEVVETLQARLDEASLSLSSMEEERVRLEGQVEAREEEIARLGRQMGSDSNLEKVPCFFPEFFILSPSAAAAAALSSLSICPSLRFETK